MRLNILLKLALQAISACMMNKQRDAVDSKYKTLALNLLSSHIFYKSITCQWYQMKVDVTSPVIGYLSCLGYTGKNLEKISFS